MPYRQLVSDYYQTNDIGETEAKMHCADLVEIYKYLTKKKDLHLELSVDDMSLVLYRDEQSPVARICVTPLAFIKTTIKELQGQQVDKYKPFENIFRFFDMQIAKHNSGKKQFTDIITQLAKNKDASQLMKFHNFLKSCEEERKIPECRIQNLDVEEFLGIGSYGAVLKVRSLVNSEVFALKVSNIYSADSLMRESFSLYALRHPNIVRFFGFCMDKENLLVKAEIKEQNEYKRKRKIEMVNELISDNGKNKFAYMKMEYCAFGDLQNYIRQHYSQSNPVPIPELEIIFGQLISAVSHVHTKRLAHRDLKPENVLIKQIKPFVWLKLCDFGCARMTNSVMVTQCVGTPITNHPDVAAGNYSSITELYSLGIIMYMVLYTQHPFSDCSCELDIIEKTKKGDFDYPIYSDEYIPFIELTKWLMALGQVSIKKSETKKIEKFWGECWKNPCTQRCCAATQKAFEKHVPLTKSMMA